MMMLLIRPKVLLSKVGDHTGGVRDICFSLSYNIKELMKVHNSQERWCPMKGLHFCDVMAGTDKRSV